MQQLHQHDTVWFEWHTGSLAIGFKFPTVGSGCLVDECPSIPVIARRHRGILDTAHPYRVSAQSITIICFSSGYHLLRLVTISNYCCSFSCSYIWQSGSWFVSCSYGLISFFRYLTIPYICCLVSRAGKTLWMSAFQASRRLLNISGSTVQREPSLISRIRVGD